MNEKHKRIMRKFGITAASSDRPSETGENEVLPATAGEPGNGHGSQVGENEKKKDIARLSRIHVSRGLTVTYSVETGPGQTPRPFVSIDKRVGTDPVTGKGKWIHLHLYDLEDLENLAEGLRKMEDFGYLPSKYLRMKADPDAFLRLKKEGIFEELRKMSHRPPRKIRITGESEESSCASPHSLDSFFSEPEFFVGSENFEKLSDEQLGNLNKCLNSFVPVFESFILAGHQLHFSMEHIQKTYGLTRGEVCLLLESVKLWSIHEIEQMAKREESIYLELVYLFHSTEGNLLEKETP